MRFWLAVSLRTLVLVALWRDDPFFALAFFKFCEYNIHEGGHGVEELFEKFFVPWCEVAVINEANGWRKSGDALDIADKHGFAVEVLPTPHGYDVAILAKRTACSLKRGNLTSTGRVSRYYDRGRISPSLMKAQSPLHHGVLHGILESTENKRQKVHVLATHMTPQSALKRRDEARWLAGLARRLDSEPVVIAGDLNTLSPLDREDHGEFLLRVLRGDPRLRSKFLLPGGDPPEIDYMPMRILLAEFVDAAFVAVDAALGGILKPHATVPTALHVDKLHAAPMRLDYVLFNAVAAARLLGPDGKALHIRALVDDYTQSASDHYPLVVDLPSSSSSFSDGGNATNFATGDSLELPFMMGNNHHHLHHQKRRGGGHHPHRAGDRRFFGLPSGAARPGGGLDGVDNLGDSSSSLPAGGDAQSAASVFAAVGHEILEKQQDAVRRLDEMADERRDATPAPPCVVR